MAKKARQSWLDKRLRRIALALVIFVVSVVCVVVGWYRTSLAPVSSRTSLTKVVVHTGESVGAVAKDLAARGLVRSATAFSLYGRLHGALVIQAGTYALSPNMGIPHIFAKLSGGDVILEAVNVTIPEGYDIADIAATLQRDGVCTAQSFLRAVQASDYTQPFLQQLAGRKQIRYRLEGYLFPDTYQFLRGENPQDIVNEMLNDFATRVLTPANLKLMRAEGLSLNQVVTEASLIENEAEVEQERPLIASVIDNRLRLHMRLQIDATVDYAIGHHLAVVTDADIMDAKNAYNTYLVTGLPPGPICSPGLASIEAVLHPAHTQYLYYVAKGDGSGEHYFAKTYAQQLHNEMLREQNLQHAHS
ncbi:aminodeoxychorismate lyase [Alicyclobacillus hesperidum subsp. aegles]|uniref:endolytic transglycosylase MltG n=1 Tax=Alicyclobacillus hesperidum TaxID=89784 RepID=UPI0022297A47|nr:endolytic transglycosylase MltG [Alicyclobacillus hesperidum]GLG00338.1 aminodeoxychorismate lyase [Alicyclobacillus hesperidum subsp. aegles]